MDEARKTTGRIRQVIAWLWLACVVLTVLEAFVTPLRFYRVGMRSGVHSLAWLLAFSGAAYFARYTAYPVLRAAWRVWPWAQWALAFALPCYFFGIEAPYAFANFFWKTQDANYDDYDADVDFALLRRGSERVYFRHIDQSMNPYNKPVVVRWLPLGLRWQTPLGNQRLDSTWTVLDAETLQMVVPPDQLRALMPVGWVAPAISAPPLPPAEAAPAPPPPPPPSYHVAPDEERAYTYMEHMPTLPDGGSSGAMVAAVQQRLVLPPDAQEGRAIVGFIVRPTGKVTSAHIVQGLNASTDAALLAAVGKLPTFIPGKQNGRTVFASITLPIDIKKK